MSGPCPNCKILRPAQSREECAKEVHEKLQKYVVGNTIELSDERTFAELGLAVLEQRKFWSEFWVATDINTMFQPGGSFEGVLPDKHFPKIPETVGGFIDEVARDRSGVSYLACSDCWTPG